LQHQVRLKFELLDKRIRAAERIADFPCWGASYRERWRFQLQDVKLEAGLGVRMPARFGVLMLYNTCKNSSETYHK
jgi:hypothetical protein